MAKLITMPTSPGFTRSRFVLNRTIGSVASPFTGSIRTQEFDSVFWTAEVQLAPMRREDAVNWQSFLLNCNGPVNHFKFNDPDATTMRGTYTGDQLALQERVNETNATLSFTASTNTIAGASNTTYFSSLLVGDHIVITGSVKPNNNGTHKILTKANAYTITVSPCDYENLIDESNKSGCTIKVNQKGAKGLCFRSTGNSANGTILKGDYIGISNVTSNIPTTYTPIQYVMATEDAVETNNGGSSQNQYSVKTEPKLRVSSSNNHRVFLKPAKGLFRLQDKDVDWNADQISNYGITFNCIEVI